MLYSVTGPGPRLQWFAAIFIFGISFSSFSLAFATDTITESDTTEIATNPSSPLAGSFSDTNLQRCIDRIAAANGWTQADQITGRVDCKKHSISKLDGIEALSNVTSLDISINYISAIGPLAKLQKLEVLKLSFNTVADLRPLASLNQLTILNFANNMVTDITPLANLHQLKNLSLQNNLITDIRSLQGLTALENLNLAVNSVDNISALVHLEKLKFLSLLNNDVTDIAGLEKLTNLQGLNLRGNKIKNIENVTNLLKLSNLNLSDNGIEPGHVDSVTALGTLPQLQHVNLSGNLQISCVALSNLIAEFSSANKIVVPATAQHGITCSRR